MRPELPLIVVVILLLLAGCTSQGNGSDPGTAGSVDGETAGGGEALPGTDGDGRLSGTPAEPAVGGAGETGPSNDERFDIGYWLPLNGDGWSVIETAEDTRKVYVSQSEGDDSNSGLSPSEPVRTIEKGASLIRDDSSDWLLLRRGDSWVTSGLGRFRSGRSPEHPIVVRGYGEGEERPEIVVTGDFIDHGGKVRSNLALMGLSIRSRGNDPDSPDFSPGAERHSLRLVGGGQNILIEDCRLRFLDVVVQSFENEWGGGEYRNVVIRRSIVLDNYFHDSANSRDDRPSGAYVSGVEGLLIEENVFDHNGWYEHSALPDAGANMFNHNLYIQYDNVGNGVVVRRNIVTRGSSHGIHGRPGGLYEDNLLVENAVGLQMGYEGHPLNEGTYAVARGNVVLRGRLMDPDDTSWPRTAALWGLNLDDPGEGTVEVRDNVVAHAKHRRGTRIGIRDLPSVSYRDNIQVDWGGGLGDMDVEEVGGPRTVASYHESLGEEGSLEAFLDVVRNRKPGRWDPRYTATEVNGYVRAGFER